MVAPPRPHCTFCAAAGPLTEEHILTQRAVRLLESLGILSGQAVHFTELNHGPRPAQGSVLPELTRAFADRKRRKSSKRFYAKTVCASCNNGWMRQLDEEAFWFIEAAAATFRGRFDLPLTAGNGPALARWALMKTLCAFARDGDVVLRHHAETVRQGQMPEDVRVEVLRSSFRGLQPFAFVSSFLDHGGWIVVFRFCDYYLRLFHDPRDSSHRFARCILRGRMISPMDDSAVAFVPEDPTGTFRPPRNVVEEMQVLAFMPCGACG